MSCDSLLLTCAILAFTRKHLNVKVIWTEEMVKLTTCPLAHFKSKLVFIESKYADSFPDHAKTQEKLAANRQRLELPVQVPAQNPKSVDMSSCKATSTNRVTASATTHPTTHHVQSEASIENKYGVSCQFDSTVKKDEDCRVQVIDRKRSFDSDQENDFVKNNINDHFNKVADTLNSKLRSYEELAAQFMETHEQDLASSKNSTMRAGSKQKSSEALKKSQKAP